MASKISHKFVGAGLALLFSGLGVLAYANTLNSAWQEGFQFFATRQPSFNLVDPNYGWLLIALAFALFGLAYVFRKS